MVGDVAADQEEERKIIATVRIRLIAWGGAPNRVFGFLSDSPSPVHGRSLLTTGRYNRILQILASPFDGISPYVFDYGAQSIDLWVNDLVGDEGFDFDGVIGWVHQGSFLINSFCAPNMERMNLTISILCYA